MTTDTIHFAPPDDLDFHMLLLKASRDEVPVNGVLDDCLWLALIEQGRPHSFAAQVLGEPLEAGLIQKVGPLGAGYIRERFGKL